MTTQFFIGQVIFNFSAIVRIEAIDAELGILVEIIPWIRADGVEQGGVGQRYYANPKFCKAVF